MKNTILHLITIALAAGLSTNIHAQGTAFTYQGQLNSGDGPATGSYDFRFKLFVDSYGNTQAGSTVLTNGIPVTNGLFTVAIDFGSGIFNGTSYWLEVGVRTNGGSSYTSLAPLQALAATPYSVFANSASNAATATVAVTSTTATTATTATAVGANGVNSVAIQNNAVTAAKIAGGQVVKSLTAGASTLYDSITLAAGNNVTLTPSGQTVTIAAAAGQAVTSLNGLQGAVTLAGNSDITISTDSGTVTLGTTAVSANTASTMVKRDANGNFSAGTVTLANNLNLPTTTSSSGIIYFGGSPFLHSYGSENFFGGVAAGNFTMGGGGNVGIGFNALDANTSGNDNIAIGYSSLGQNTSGLENTAIGFQTLSQNTGGNYNTALGFGSGQNITGSYNIDIGNLGVAGDNNTMRIGAQFNQTSTYIAGIYNSTVSGVAVYVSSSGQLGVLSSSKQFKEDIDSMGAASDVLLSLRPVTFRYKPGIDPKGIAQFGLVAEEVDKVDPDLVVHDTEHGIYTVRYQAIDAMLLNEFLKEHRKVQAQDAVIQNLKQSVDDLKTMVQSLVEKK